MKTLQFSSIITLVILTMLTGCQYIDKGLDETPEIKSPNIMQKLFNINTNKGFYITLPDHKNQIKLTSFTEISTSKNEKPYVKGVLSDNEDYSAWLDYTNITALNISNNKNIFKLVAPYILTNSNPASDDKRSNLNSPDLPSSALYLGAFELDYRTNNINQYGQQLLGNYSTLTAIDYDGQETVNVVIRQYQTDNDQDKKINSSVHKLTFNVGKEMILVDDTVVE